LSNSSWSISVVPALISDTVSTTYTNFGSSSFSSSFGGISRRSTLMK
jgi:hypothetical protein